jgi:hypothetical protein
MGLLAQPFDLFPQGGRKLGRFVGTSHGLIQNVPRQLPDAYMRVRQTPFEQGQVVLAAQAGFGKG